MKISVWIIVGLIISAICVSSLGAYFSIIGIGALFSGAMVAVWLMAGSLELSKFVLAAYIHQRWHEMGKTFKYYLTFAIVVLSCITSLGIFGFLSDAYQSASTAIKSEQIRVDTIKNQQKMAQNEIDRLTKAIDEVPDSRISRKMKLRAELEPTIAELTKKMNDLEQNLSEKSLAMVDIQKKVGPLMYISRSFNADIDTVVKYLILIFVLVFDPLAICLVIATTQALSSRGQSQQNASTQAPHTQNANVSSAIIPNSSVANEIAPATATPVAAASAETLPVQTASETISQPTSPPADPYADAEMIEMSFEDPAAEVDKTASDKKTS